MGVEEAELSAASSDLALLAKKLSALKRLRNTNLTVGTLQYEKWRN